MKKRLLSVLLALTMVLSLLPIAAFAAELTEAQKADLKAKGYTDEQIQAINDQIADYDSDEVLLVFEDTVISQAENRLILVVAPQTTVTVEAADVSTGIVVLPGAAEAKVVLKADADVNAVVVLDKAEVTVEADAKAEHVTVAAAEAKVDVAGTATNVTVDAAAEKAAVTVSGTATNVTVAAPAATATVTGTAAKVDVAETATGSAVTVTETAKVDAVTVSAPEAAATVSGTVSSVTVANTASGSAVTVTETAAVDSVTSHADNVTATVNGSVGSVTNNGEGASITVGESAKVDTVTNNGTADVTVNNGSTTVVGDPDKTTSNVEVTKPADPVVDVSTPTSIVAGVAGLTDATPDDLTGGHAENYTYSSSYAGKTTVCTEDNITVDSFNVVIKAEKLEKHENGANTEGYWVGLAIPVPADKRGTTGDADPVHGSTTSAYKYYYIQINSAEEKAQIQSGDANWTNDPGVVDSASSRWQELGDGNWCNTIYFDVNPDNTEQSIGNKEVAVAVVDTTKGENPDATFDPTAVLEVLYVSFQGSTTESATNGNNTTETVVEYTDDGATKTTSVTSSYSGTEQAGEDGVTTKLDTSIVTVKESTAEGKFEEFGTSEEKSVTKTATETKTEKVTVDEQEVTKTTITSTTYEEDAEGNMVEKETIGSVKIGDGPSTPVENPDPIELPGEAPNGGASGNQT